MSSSDLKSRIQSPSRTKAFLTTKSFKIEKTPNKKLTSPEGEKKNMEQMLEQPCRETPLRKTRSIQTQTRRSMRIRPKTRSTGHVAGEEGEEEEDEGEEEEEPNHKKIEEERDDEEEGKEKEKESKSFSTLSAFKSKNKQIEIGAIHEKSIQKEEKKKKQDSTTYVQPDVRKSPRSTRLYATLELKFYYQYFRNPGCKPISMIHASTNQEFVPLYNPSIACNSSSMVPSQEHHQKAFLKSKKETQDCSKKQSIPFGFGSRRRHAQDRVQEEEEEEPSEDETVGVKEEKEKEKEKEGPIEHHSISHNCIDSAYFGQDFDAKPRLCNMDGDVQEFTPGCLEVSTHREGWDLETVSEMAQACPKHYIDFFKKLSRDLSSDPFSSSSSSSLGVSSSSSSLGHGPKEKRTKRPTLSEVSCPIVVSIDTEWVQNMCRLHSEDKLSAKDIHWPKSNLARLTVALHVRALSFDWKLQACVKELCSFQFHISDLHLSNLSSFRKALGPIGPIQTDKNVNLSMLYWSPFEHACLTVDLNLSQMVFHLDEFDISLSLADLAQSRVESVERMKTEVQELEIKRIEAVQQAEKQKSIMMDARYQASSLQTFTLEVARSCSVSRALIHSFLVPPSVISDMMTDIPFDMFSPSYALEQKLFKYFVNQTCLVSERLGLPLVEHLLDNLNRVPQERSSLAFFSSSSCSSSSSSSSSSTSILSASGNPKSDKCRGFDFDYSRLDTSVILSLLDCTVEVICLDSRAKIYASDNVDECSMSKGKEKSMNYPYLVRNILQEGIRLDLKHGSGIPWLARGQCDIFTIILAAHQHVTSTLNCTCPSSLPDEMELDVEFLHANPETDKLWNTTFYDGEEEEEEEEEEKEEEKEEKEEASLKNSKWDEKRQTASAKSKKIASNSARAMSWVLRESMKCPRMVRLQKKGLPLLHKVALCDLYDHGTVGDMLSGNDCETKAAALIAVARALSHLERRLLCLDKPFARKSQEQSFSSSFSSSSSSKRSFPSSSSSSCGRERFFEHPSEILLHAMGDVVEEYEFLLAVGVTLPKSVKQMRKTKQQEEEERELWRRRQVVSSGCLSREEVSKHAVCHVFVLGFPKKTLGEMLVHGMKIALEREKLFERLKETGQGPSEKDYMEWKKNYMSWASSRSLEQGMKRETFTCTFTCTSTCTPTCTPTSTSTSRFPSSSSSSSSLSSSSRSLSSSPSRFLSQPSSTSSTTCTPSSTSSTACTSSTWWWNPRFQASLPILLLESTENPRTLQSPLHVPYVDQTVQQLRHANVDKQTKQHYQQRFAEKERDSMYGKLREQIGTKLRRAYGYKCVLERDDYALYYVLSQIMLGSMNLCTCIKYDKSSKTVQSTCKRILWLRHELGIQEEWALSGLHYATSLSVFDVHEFKESAHFKQVIFSDPRQMRNQSLVPQISAALVPICGANSQKNLDMIRFYLDNNPKPPMFELPSHGPWVLDQSHEFDTRHNHQPRRKQHELVFEQNKNCMSELYVMSYIWEANRDISRSNRQKLTRPELKSNCVYIVMSLVDWKVRVDRHVKILGRFEGELRCTGSGEEFVMLWVLPAESA